MALDPRILFMGAQAGASVPNLAQSVLQGARAAQEIRQMPLLEEMQKLQLEQTRQQASGGPSAFRSFAPVMGTGPSGEGALLAPRVNPQTGEAELVPLDLPSGFSLQNNQAQAEFERDVDLAQERARIEIAKQKELAEIGVSKAEKVEQAKRVAAERADIRKRFRERGNVAKDTVRTGNKLKKALSDLNTGRVAQARQSLSSVIPGIRDAKAEEFVALTNNFILEQAQKLTGVLSDTDIALLRSTGPQLGNTVEGNLRIIQNITEAADHARKEETRFRKFVKQGGNPEDFQYEEKDFISAPLEAQGEAQGTGEFEGFSIVR